MMAGYEIIPTNTLAAWQKWVDLTRSRCHLHFKLEGGTIESHIEVCLQSTRATINRVSKDLPNDFRPRRILEIGASVGFNSLALAEHFEDAEVYSVEPDAEAVEVASAMAADFSLDYTPLAGFGEHLDYPDDYFDLIICHTVIEHVNSVPAVVAEMARVISPTGIIHLEAPNYLWPFEPHLDVWCIPLLGKPLLRAMSWLQGKSKDNWYVGHLQFVTPFSLEREFRRNQLAWENRVEKKLKGLIDGGSYIKRYHAASNLVNIFNKVGLTRLVVFLVIRMGLYPSVMYSLRKS